MAKIISALLLMMSAWLLLAVYFRILSSTEIELSEQLLTQRNSIDTIEMRRPSQKNFTLNRGGQNKTWELSQPRSIFVDPAKVAELADALLSLSGTQKKAPRSSKRFSAPLINYYQGQQLQLSIRLQDVNDEVTALILQKQIFYRLESSPQLSWFLTELRRPTLPLAPLSLTITGQQILIAGDAQKIHLQKASDQRYYFVSPYAGSLADQRKLEQVFAPLTKSLPLLAVDNNRSATPQKWTEISFFDAHGRWQRLLLGGASGGDLFAYLPPNPELLLVPGTLKPLTQIVPFELLKKKINLPPLAQIRQMSYQHHNKGLSIHLSRSHKMVRARINTREVSFKKVEKYYQYLKSIFYEDEIERRFYPSGQPSAVLIYQQENGRSTRINFYAYPDDHDYAVSVDGQNPIFLVGDYQLIRLEAISKALFSELSWQTIN